MIAGTRLRSHVVAAVLLAAFASWTAVRAATTDGFVEADEVAHHLYARHAPAHPMNLLHVWARPLFTAVLMPFAQGGTAGSRFLSVTCAAAAAAFAYFAARAFGWRAAWSAVPFAFAQPLFFQQSTGIWTEMFFAAMLGAWALAIARERPRTAALLAALLPLARPEGVLIAAATGCASIAGGLRDRSGSPRRLFVLMILPAGVLLWAALGFLSSGDPLWLPRHWPRNWSPTASYGSGGWTWVFHALVQAASWVVLPLAAIGCLAPGWRRRWTILLGAFLILAVHAVLWALGAFGSAGYARYFVTLAPVLALLAAGGVDVLARVVPRVPAALPAAAFGVLAVVVLVRHESATVRPTMPPDGRLFSALGRHLRTHHPNPVLFSAHPFAYLDLDSVPSDRFEDFGHVREDVLRAAPHGAWVLVEDRFWLAPRDEGGGASTTNPAEADLAGMGFRRFDAPDLAVDLRADDPRHDGAIARMHWALYRKATR